MSLEFTEDNFRERLSHFATAETINRHLPKKRKKQSNGICHCCGKPCAPFTTCKEYRDKQSVGHVLRNEVKAGRIRVVGRNGRELVYETTEEGKLYYSSLAGTRQHVRHQGSKERERNLKRQKVLP